MARRPLRGGSRTMARGACALAFAVAAGAGFGGSPALAQQPPASPPGEGAPGDPPGEPIPLPGAPADPGRRGPWEAPSFGPAVPPTFFVSRRADNGMFAGGLLLLAGSAVLAIGGMVGTATSVGRIQVFCTHLGSASYPCEQRTDAALLGGGVAALVGGLGGLAGAIFLVAKGGKTTQVPASGLGFDARGLTLAF